MGRLGSRLTTLSMKGRENRHIKRAAELAQQLFAVLLITFLLLLLVESIWERSVSSYLSLDYLLIAVIVVGVTAVLARPERVRAQIDEPTEPDGLGGALIGARPVEEPESGSKSGCEDANELKPRATWVWDHSKRAWVEKIEEPTVEEFSAADGLETGASVLTRPEGVRGEKRRLGRGDIVTVVCAGLAGIAIVWYKTEEIGWLSYVISVISGGLIVLLFLLIWREGDEEEDSQGH